MEALSILYNLMDQQSDRSVKIVISQTISRIARLCHDNAKAVRIFSDKDFHHRNHILMVIKWSYF
jgi:hypothetical protein